MSLVTVDAHKAAQGAVVPDKGIGDRADHLRVALAEARIENVLQVDHVRLARGIGLVIHAVVRRQRDDRA